jgi:hypothetical protein
MAVSLARMLGTVLPSAASEPAPHRDDERADSPDASRKDEHAEDDLARRQADLKSFFSTALGIFDGEDDPTENAAREADAAPYPDRLSHQAQSGDLEERAA